MKKTLTLLFLFFVCHISAQEFKEVEMCDLKFETNKDSTEMIVFKNGKTLSGNYKITGVFPEQHSLTDFVNGKAEGKSVTIYKGITIREKHFKNGLPNGLWIEYDDSGKTIMRKIPYSNGKLHGIGSFNGKENYYWNDERVSKLEYEKNLTEQKR
ncbi:hypothetical protein [Winogradskyella eximia]|uniref:hypothetical protein n=1 Tax=Winogradskyella eximia TaxID=262006 RepID=UPI0024934DCD|nr:hypothetical protein [Winogradskyella eximia]